MSQPAADSLATARSAFASHDWPRAADLFRDAEAGERLSPEDLESMGEAAWLAARPDDSIAALQRAYAAYLEAGNQARAGFVAVVLAREFGVKMASALSGSWLNRAKRLLDAQPEGAEHGYLYARQSVLALNEGSIDQAIELAKRTIELGERVGDANLQAIGSVCYGGALIERGDVAAGLALMDDAAIAAVTGELGLYATGMVYCNTIATCCEIADFRRAGDWADAARKWSESHPYQPLIPGDCRVHQAEVLALRGAWAEAEESARQGAEELRAYNRLAHVGEAQYQVGEIRLRMGDLPAAHEAFRQASEMGRDPQPGMSMLALAEGRTDAALASIRRALDETDSRLERRRLLPAFIEIGIRAGMLPEAQEAASELESIATTYDAPAFRATAHTARGAVQLAAGDDRAAARSLHLAVTGWQEVDAPYDAARARALLATAIARQGDQEGSVMELGAVRAVFERLGAARDLAAIDAQLAALGSSAQPGDATPSVRAFLFTDIVKSTSLVEAIGDDAWLDLLRWHDRTLRGLFAEHGGEEIDHAGDGFFVAFADAHAALSCAVAIQRTLVEHRQSHGFAPHVREGVHLTAARRSGSGYSGKGVHAAARIAAAAEGGQILVSQASLGNAAAAFPTSPPLSMKLRGISEPVDVVSVDWRAAAG
jgi:class 3 adenylate cyclase